MKRKKAYTWLKIFLFSIVSVLIFTGCDNILFDGDIKNQVANDIKVTYSFYEYYDLDSDHKDVDFIIGRSASEKDFPVCEHEESMITGWHYFMNPDTGREIMPSNFITDEKSNITAFKVTPQPAALYATWAKKCYVNFVTNCDTELEQIIIAEGDTLKGKV